MAAFKFLNKLSSIFFIFTTTAFMICGALIFSMSVYCLTSSDVYKVFVKASSDLGVYEFIAKRFVHYGLSNGLFLIMAGLIGLLGFCTNHKLLLYSFIVYNALVIIVIIGILFWFNNYDFAVNKQTKAQIALHFRNVYGKVTVDTNVVDLTQKNFECCGVQGPADFIYSQYYNKTSNIIPKSCCKMYTRDPNEFASDKKYFNECLSQASNFINYHNTTTDLFFNRSCYDSALLILKRLKVIITVTSIVLLILEVGLISCIVYMIKSNYKLTDDDDGNSSDLGSDTGLLGDKKGTSENANLKGVAPQNPGYQTFNGDSVSV